MKRKPRPVAALDERAKSLIGVEQAAGIWDIDF
jgi:hypothetical protein